MTPARPITPFCDLLQPRDAELPVVAAEAHHPDEEQDLREEDVAVLGVQQVVETADVHERLDDSREQHNGDACTGNRREANEHGREQPAAVLQREQPSRCR